MGKAGRSTVDVRLGGEIDGNNLDFGSLLTGPATRSCGQYRLRIRRGRLLEIGIARRDGRLMDVERLRFAFCVPLLNFSRVIVPDCGRFYVDSLRAISLRSGLYELCAPNDGMPFLSFVGQQGTVEFSFGLAGNLVETTFRCVAPRISSRGALFGGEERLIVEAVKPSTGWTCGRTRRVRESIYVGGASPTWHDALRSYSRLVRQRSGATYTDRKGAWLPTWCTWTAWPSEEMTEQKILANARVASRLGIGSIIIDDGWFGLGMDTDTGRLNMGVTRPDPKKLPDLPGLVERLHKMGLKVLLWYAPVSLAPESPVYRRLKGLVMTDGLRPYVSVNGLQSLCPRNPRVRRHIAGEIRHMLRDYGVDGFKTDLYNCLPSKPCRADHTHDCDSAVEGLHRVLETVWRTLCEERPDGLLELKQNYGNVICAQFGTMVRAGDAAYDVDTNLMRCFYTQAYAPVVHNDYLAWSIHELPSHLAVMLVKQMAAGVPTFSRDLPSLPEGHLRVLGAWLGFYREHLELFRRPRRPMSNDLSVWRIGGGERPIFAVVGVGGEVPLASRVKQAFVLNGSGRAELPIVSDRSVRASVTVYDHTLKPVGSRRMSIGGTSAIQVPPGGMAVIRAGG